MVFESVLKFLFVGWCASVFVCVSLQVMRAMVSQMITPPTTHNVMVQAIATLKAPPGVAKAFRAWKSRFVFAVVWCPALC